MHSCLYEGHVAHQRRQPVAHAFRYGLNMVYFDLDEIPRLVDDRIIGDRKLSLASFLPEDHLALASVEQARLSLRARIEQTVELQTGHAVRGPIRLLTQLRYFGYYFSPLNLYYCFDQAGERVVAIVAEVSNTPWNEQHLYILHDGNRAQADENSFAHSKTFHVSPFMHMNMQYRWEVSTPTDTLRVQLSNAENGTEAAFFGAQLQLTRRPLTRASMARALIRYPLMTAQIFGAIYFQAFQLWWKACPYYPHPKTPSNLPQTQTVN